MHKSILMVLMFFLFFSPAHANSKIVETHSFSDILSEVDPQTFVFFDIDDTLINTASQLGNTPWWGYFTAKLKSAGLSLDKSQLEIHAVIQKIIRRVPMRLIEPEMADVIQGLQMQGIRTFGLTARCINPDYMPAADLGTHEHLKSVNIDFSRHLITNLEGHKLHFFSYGIIFTDHQEKGPFLRNFLNHMGLHPEKIIFIDDSMKHIKSVDHVLTEMGIPCICFRYSRMDHFHSHFDPLIGNIQLEALIQKDQVLTDEEALNIARERPGLDPDYFVNQLIQAWQQ
jgi:hypothetical protein